MRYEQAKAQAEIMKALAHPTRVVIVDALRQSDRYVSELNRLVKIRQPTLTRHLAQLKKAGIVTEYRRGARVMHHLACPCMLKAFECASAVINSRMESHAKAV